MKKQLVLFPKGTLTPKDKERMTKQGYLAIECDDPSKVIMPMPTGELFTGNDLICAALQALADLSGGHQSTSEVKARVLSHLTKRILAKESSK